MTETEYGRRVAQAFLEELGEIEKSAAGPPGNLIPVPEGVGAPPNPPAGLAPPATSYTPRNQFAKPVMPAPMATAAKKFMNSPAGMNR